MTVATLPLVAEGQPSPFLAGNPFVQFAWDSTSAKAAKACLRRYWYEIVLGWVSRRRQIELDFGIAAHMVLEVYHRELALSGHREHAIRQTVTFVLKAFKGWTCEEDHLRSRDALLRLAVWFADDFAEDPLRTMVGEDGAPAVEEHFLLPLPLEAEPGQPYLWGGHRDRRVWDGTAVSVEDFKTTTQTLSPGFYRRFAPDLQMTGYYGAGKAQIPLFGTVIVTAIQVAKGFLRFERAELYRTPEHVAEWWEGIRWLLARVRECAEATLTPALAGAPDFVVEANWPLNEESCFRCPFRGVCSETPRLRGGLLETNFVRRPWNPLVPRTARRLDKPWMGDKEGEGLR